MAQRKFYFQKRIFLGSGKFILQTKFYDFVAICYAAGKTIFLERSVFSKDYRLKEQTWLATYVVRCPRKFIKEVTPVKRKSNPPFYPDLQRYF